MKKQLGFLCMIFMMLSASKINAQVDGISYTLSPMVEYNLWDDKTGFDDNIMYGGQLGFGFGEFVELRGLYLQSLDLQTNFEGFPFENDVDLSNYVAKDLELRKYGGELKLNLLPTAFKPYFALGAGIQDFRLKDVEGAERIEQLYVNYGLGMKVSVAKRYTIGVQAMNHRYKVNAVNALLSSDEITALDIDPSQYEPFSTSNWTLRAGLELYLGGRKPGKLSRTDKAFLNAFSGGFKGLSVPFEPVIGKLNFSEDLGYRDTYMAGASAGLDFGPLVGMRAFYWRALQDGEATKFDDLAMYGAEMKFKLGEGRGVIPYITMGGGKLDAFNGYVGQDSLTTVEDKGFAMGGLGVDLPFSKAIKLTGYVRSFVVAEDSADEVVGPKDIVANWMYGASINFIIGKGKRKIEVNDPLETGLFETEVLINEYEEQLEVINEDIVDAIQEGDIEKASELKKSQDITTSALESLEATKQRELTQNLNYASGNTSGINMTPAEFQNLLSMLLSYQNTKAASPAVSQGIATSSDNQVDDAIKDLELKNKLEKLAESVAELKSSMKDQKMDQKDNNREMLESLEKYIDQEVKGLNSRLNNIDNKVEATKTEMLIRNSQSSSTPNQTGQAPEIIIQKEIVEVMPEFESDEISREEAIAMARLEIEDEIRYENQLKQAQQNSFIDTANSDNSSEYTNNETAQTTLRYEGMAGIIGFSLGDANTLNIGYRSYYQYKDTKFTFVPEAFFGFGSPSSFGLTANAHYDFGLLKKALIRPYAGAGVGFIKTGGDLDADKIKGAFNLTIGAQLFKVLNGRMFVDITTRNFGSENQLIAGYRLPF